MDPEKGGARQRLLTGLLRPILGAAYLVLRLRHRGRDAPRSDPPHLIPPPGRPIDSYRLALALNPKTEPARLVKLAQDPDPFVRRAAARNPAMPRVVVTELARDPEPLVAAEARLVLAGTDVHVDDGLPLT